jgi:choline kinase
MRGIITAAARSPRLLPLTKHTPVSLLEVGGRPILEHQLQSLKQAGIEDVTVITGFCADQVEELCRGKATCVFNPFFEVCNVAMNLWLVRNQSRSAFVLVYDDVLFEAELIRQAARSDAGTLLVVDRKGVDREAEKVVLAEGVVTAIGKDVTGPFGEFIGVAMFSEPVIPVLVEELERLSRTDLGTTFPQFVQRLVRRGQEVSVLATDLPWCDIDFPADLEEARRRWG